MEFFEAGSAILGCAGAAYKLVKAILEIASEAPTIGDRMRKDTLPLRAFSDLIKTALYSIKYRLPHVNSTVLYMRNRQMLYNIDLEAAELLKDINLQICKIGKLQSNLGDKGTSALRFYAAYRWKNTRSPKLELLQPRMEQLKSTLQLIIAVIQLEVLSQNRGASQSDSRFNEIQELRSLIGKHIEAFRQLRRNFRGQAGRPGEGNSAAGICHLAYIVAKTGMVPRDNPPARFNFAQLIDSPIMDVDPRQWVPSSSTLTAGTTICPHCNLNIDTTDHNASSRNRSPVAQVSNNASPIDRDREPEPMATQPQPVTDPAQKRETWTEPDPDEPLEMVPLPEENQTNGLNNRYLGKVIHRGRTTSRSPRPRQPTKVEKVLVRHKSGVWMQELVIFDPNLEIRNRHGLRGAEVPYGGLISESYMDILDLRSTLRPFSSNFVFPYDEEHRSVRGAGTIEIEWKKQPGIDDWEDLVVDKPKVKCIVCREMPCKERLVLKQH